MSIAPKTRYPHELLFARKRYDAEARVTLRDMSSYASSFFEQHKTIAAVSHQLLHGANSHLLQRSEPCLLDGLVEESELCQTLLQSEHFFSSSCILTRCATMLLGLLPADIDSGRLVYFASQADLDAAAGEALDILLKATPLTPQLAAVIQCARNEFINDPDDADFAFEKIAEAIDDSSRLIEINNLFLRAQSFPPKD